MRRTFALAAAVTFGVAACSSSASSKPAATPASHSVTATTVASSATPAPTTTQAAAAGGLTGFGATQAVWDAHHAADTDKTGAGVYSPDPALPKTKDGQVNDDYVAAVASDDGHVDAYNLLFTARPTAAALDRVRQELPPDAQFGKPVVTSGVADSKCLVLTATSATVGRVLGGANGSRIEIELQSWDPTVLDQSAISSAALVTANKGDAPGC
jgi:hypothetical protein